MATDPLGNYWGQGNQGLATILPRERQGDYFDVALQGEQAKRKLAADRQQQASDLLKDLKPEEYYNVFNELANNEYGEIVNGITTGKLGPGEVKKRVGEYVQNGKQSMQIQSQAKEVENTWKADPRVKPGAFGNMMQDVLGGRSKEDLKRLMYQGIPADWILQPGKSDNIDASEAFKYVIENKLAELESIDESDPRREQYGEAINMFSKARRKVSKKNFLKEEGGVFSVEEFEQLKNSKILDTFMEDPYTKAIIEDELEAKGLENTQENQYQILKEKLTPFAGGKVEETRIDQLTRDYVDGGSRIDLNLDPLIRDILKVNYMQGADSDSLVQQYKNKYGEAPMEAEWIDALAGTPKEFNFMKGAKITGDAEAGVVKNKDGKLYVELVDSFGDVVGEEPLTIDMIDKRYSQTERKRFREIIQKLGLLEANGEIRYDPNLPERLGVQQERTGPYIPGQQQTKGRGNSGPYIPGQ